MPELPEVTTYVEAFRRHIVGRTLGAVRIRSPSLLRTFDPPIGHAHGRRVTGVRRLAKRIVWELEGGLFLVFHLMVTGRFHRRKAPTSLPRRNVHAAFDFEEETYLLTEVGKKKKASLHLVRGEEGLAALDPGGLEPLQAEPEEFAAALRRENRTLKRALTDPRILSGIGNAHSDEILHAARLSPVQLTRNLDDAEVERLRIATMEHLRRWIERLIEDTGDAFPERISAFHPDMAVHGRFGKPCPRCGDPVQRILYAERETNYCATCQTGGRLLADRALSRLLQADWPRSLEELDEHTGSRRRDAAPEATEKRCWIARIRRIPEVQHEPRSRTMEIARNGSRPSEKGPTDWFTGAVRIDPLFRAEEPARVAGASVTFEPGARTAWHTHPLGQTLIVTAGCGWAQREGGPIEELRPGDVVWFSPGEKHWHGATATTAMTHIAVQERLEGSAVDWLEKVTDEQYRARLRAP